MVCQLYFMTEFKLNFLTAIVTALLFCSISAFSGLNDPIQKVITVRSEIERGASAVETEYNNLDKINNDLLFSSAENILKINQQANTDTDALKLGVYYTLWFYFTLSSDIDPKSRTGFLGSQCFSRWTYYCQELGVSIDDIRGLNIPQIPDLDSEMRRWRKIYDEGGSSLPTEKISK